MAEKSNVEGYEETVDNDDQTFNNKPTEVEIEELSLYGVLRRLISAIVPSDGDDSAPLLQRIRASVSDNAPLLPEASRNTSRNVLLWTRRGSPLRALLVLSVGGIIFLSLTGLLVFMLFFFVATFNVIVVSLIVSLAAAGGFLALFFACVAAIYVCALSIAAFVISVTVISATIAVIITTGWIGFFCTVWLATKTSMGLAKRSLSATSSALSAYSNARHSRGRNHDKVSD